MQSKFPSVRALQAILLISILLTGWAVVAARQAGEGRRGIGLKPAAKRVESPPESKAGPMRLVVQLGHQSFQYGFATFSSDGRLAATGASGDVVLWDVATGREVRSFSGNEGDPGAQDVDG